jgi:tRNA(Ile)-lysidine synthetase-like protein
LIPKENLDFQQFAYLLEAPKAHDPQDFGAFEAVRKCVGNVEGPRVAVSISGGVDSMVAAWIAAAACKAVGKELVLLHISYMNRAECEDECQLLRWYSQRLGAPLYIRRITEIQRIRASGLRAVYEDVTRRIRFAFYRHFACPVILGHNQDDCMENVFRNLSQRIHMDNLFGMSAIGEEQGVTVLRPMLGIPKAVLVAFADREGIPHLYDSTPAWSQRGRMRDTLIPSIRAFDAGILGGLLEMVERSRFLEEQWSLGVSEWLRGIVGNVVQRDAFLESNRCQAEFWVRVFRHTGFRPSNKSIRNFMDMLEKGHEGRCTRQFRIDQSEMSGYRLESSVPKIQRCNLNGEWVALIAVDSIEIKKAMCSIKS